MIAEDLVLSPETVRTHVKNLLRKLGVNSRREASEEDCVAATDTANPLVGREVELRVLAEMLAGLETTDRALILQVAGEPGIGKSRLLRELAAQAGSRGHLVLSGRSAEFEAEHPFGVFGDALDDWLVGQGPERLEALAAGLATELAMVFPAFGPLASARVEVQQEERYRAYRAVRGLLSSLARATPIVLALDDVQWADPGSVELIGHLLAHPCRGAVLVALGVRPAQVSPRLSAALAAAFEEPSARRLELKPLSPAAARALLGSRVSGAVGDRLYRESGGNPFYLLQLARGHALAGRPSTASGAIGSSVPEAVRAALATELSSLSARGLLMLQGATPSRGRWRRARPASMQAKRWISSMSCWRLSSSTRPLSAGSSPFATRSSARRSTSSSQAAGGLVRTLGSRRCSP